MYCYKCGNTIGQEDKFCLTCGTSLAPEAPETTQAPETPEAPMEQQSQPYEQQPQQPQPYEQQPPQPQPYEQQPPQPYEYPAFPQTPPPAKKPGMALWITVASVVLVLAAAVTVYFVYFRDTGHRAKIGRAFSNFSAEIEERINNTPLKVFAMLPEILEDGTLTADFLYSYNIFGDWFPIDIGGTIELQSNTTEREFALSAAINDAGDFFEVDLYMNKERLAARLGFFDSNYYGIRYDTFREDIRTFGKLLLLDDEVMDGLADAVDMLSEFLNSGDPDTTTGLITPYDTILIDFVGNLKSTSKKTQIDSAGQRVSCTAIEMKIGKSDIITLLRDILETVENDENIRSQFDMYVTGFNAYDMMLMEFENAIRDIDRSFKGEIILTFNIDDSDRLLSFVIEADVEVEGVGAYFNIALALGNSVHDDWTWSFSGGEDKRTVDEAMQFTWIYKQESNVYTNQLKVNAMYSPEISFISTLDNSTGKFSLGFADSWDFYEITGVFTSDDKNFRLALDNLLGDDSGNKLTVELSGKTGTQIKQIDFINIDKWGETLIDAITRFIFGMIF